MARRIVYVQLVLPRVLQIHLNLHRVVSPMTASAPNVLVRASKAHTNRVRAQGQMTVFVQRVSHATQKNMK